MNGFNLTQWALSHRAVVLFLILQAVNIFLSTSGWIGLIWTQL